MKYIIWMIVVVLAIIGIVVWLKGAPKDEAPKSVSSTPKTEAPQQSKTVISTKTIQGMKIETTQEGTGTPITKGQTAVVDYVGKLADGSVFDASARHGQSFSFPLGAGQVIKGWDEGVNGMKIGETRVLTIPPELGYGAAGYPPVIPQNATLTFEVTLRDIK
jgi:FKBP-type peptidyl-prolyl cis-trans isomerase FkpA